ncbi:MAG: tetratricopeptide repeat protein [Nitrospina sp.]|jgi:tetratricopeptide (TPR) repeat protein|nr:tetratricopeptide repeat protein [Nitrospina sp.]
MLAFPSRRFSSLISLLIFLFFALFSSPAWSQGGAHFKSGLDAYRAEKFSEALAHFQKVVEVSPKNAQAYLFMGLVRQKTGHYAEAITSFIKARDLRPELAQVAQLNIGLSYMKLGQPEKAHQELSRAVDMDPHSEVGGDATALLNSLSEEEKPEKLWKVTASFGWEYDDNVTREEEDTVTEVADYSTVYEVAGTYRVLKHEGYEVEAGYEFFQSLYEDVTAFNFQSHGFTFSGTKEFGRWDTGLDYGFTQNMLDGNNFLGIHSIVPSVGFATGENMFTHVSYMLLDKNFQSGDNDPRDAVNHSIGVNHFIFFNQNKAYVLLGYQLASENTRGAEFDYTGHRLSAAVQSPAWWSTKAKLSYTFALKDFSNVTSSIGEERLDKKNTLHFLLSRKFLDHFEGKIDYQHIISDSNLASVDFDQNVLKLEVGFSY